MFSSFRRACHIDYGTSWNTAANYSQGWSSIIWGLSNLSSNKLCRSFEVPFANAGGTTVTQSRLRVLGNDIAKSLKTFFQAYEENGGKFVQQGTFKLNCWYNNTCEVIDGGLLEAKAINLGNDADQGSGGKLIVSNATATASSIAVCADDRHRAQYIYLYEDDGKTSSITVSGDLTVAASQSSTRNGRDSRVYVNGGDLAVGGNLRIGTPFEKAQTNKLVVARSNSKVTAATMALNNNSEIVITVPEFGFDEVPLQISGTAAFNHASGLSIDVSSAKPGKYTVLTAGGFTGLDEADITLVNTGRHDAEIILTDTSVIAKVHGEPLVIIFQ